MQQPNADAEAVSDPAPGTDAALPVEARDGVQAGGGTTSSSQPAQQEQAQQAEDDLQAELAQRRQQSLQAAEVQRELQQQEAAGQEARQQEPSIALRRPTQQQQSAEGDTAGGGDAVDMADELAHADVVSSNPYCRWHRFNHV